jgi:serine protease
MAASKGKTVSTPDKLASRKPPAKPPRKAQGYWPRVIVKFHDHVNLPYRDGAESALASLGIGEWDRLVKQVPGLTLRRLYTALEPEKIRGLLERAKATDRDYEPPNLLTYFQVDCPLGTAPGVLVQAFLGWPSVEKAYFDPPGIDPVDPDNDPEFDNQGYLDPAPDGIDAEFAWPRSDGSGFAGGDGAGIAIIDMEQGWTLDHEDLAAHGATLLHGTLRDSSRPHGTSVLGELCAVDNGLGCIGIASGIASIHVVSRFGSSIPDATMAAIANLDFGDVLLLEVQDTVSFAGVDTLMPSETLDANFDTIRLATALGIIVVAAAGNGNADLDLFANAAGDRILNRGSPGFRDSGAIVVGGCFSASPHSRRPNSNFGSRIDCYGWGQNVTTCDSTEAGATNLYTNGFTGTSSASPIIAGAALIVQGIAQANLHYRFGPLQMRAILTNPTTSTPSNNPAVDRIGVLPNLRAILEDEALDVGQLRLVPDVYLRDNVGDTGDPHSGGISSSPDIILLPASVASPQVAFGEGSLTENSSTLGAQAETGHDNFIYVRVRNRGGSDAANVTARVFWAPVATLVTPDLWTAVGSSVLPNVPTGDLLTVGPEIVWPAAAIPGPGHYCFVGVLDHPQDPAPNPGDLLDFDAFRRFIRENNNVTWRNFNVVEPDPSDPDAESVLPFLAVGAPDKARRMRLEAVARLPKGARIWLEAPIAFQNAQRYRPPHHKVDKKRGRVRIPVNPHGAFTFDEVLFPAKARFRMRLIVQLPKGSRTAPYEAYVRQLHAKEEVGRVTWRLVPPKRPRK